MWVTSGLGAVFPARAGMSQAGKSFLLRAVSFPRPRGDEPFGFTVPLRWDPFSPPARG